MRPLSVLFRLLVAVGVLLCLVGVSGHAHDTGTSAHPAHAHATGMDRTAPQSHQAPEAPEHHGGADGHAHGCMSALPGPDAQDGAMAVPVLLPGTTAGPAGPSTGAVVAPEAGLATGPPGDLHVLCVWRL